MFDSRNRKALDNITNLSEIVPREDKKQSVQDAKDMFPVIDVDTDVQSSEEISIPKNFYLQNVHPLLAIYKHDFKTNHMSY